ncbi:LemA family protein [archaeon]|nr:LemA family protein [archaeon]|tara:strand:- start:13464 stop:14051 length:588 start_codon:yes stop_codon:yes gene_type:complete
MKKNTKWLIGVGVVVLILIFWFVGTYNSLISLDETVNEKWAQVENQYQRRADLIPNLIETVKGARDFEANTQADIAKLRTQATQIKNTVDAGLSPGQLNGIDSQMTSVLRGLNIVVEAYPTLRATENFLALQSQLEGTENRISTERMRYNEVIKKFNVKVKRIPSKWVAGYLGYEEKEFFESDEGADVVPDVDFS